MFWVIYFSFKNTTTAPAPSTAPVPTIAPASVSTPKAVPTAAVLMPVAALPPQTLPLVATHNLPQQLPPQPLSQASTVTLQKKEQPTGTEAESVAMETPQIEAASVPVEASQGPSRAPHNGAMDSATQSTLEEAAYIVLAGWSAQAANELPKPVSMSTTNASMTTLPHDSQGHSSQSKVLSATASSATMGSTLSHSLANMLATPHTPPAANMSPMSHEKKCEYINF